MEDPPSQRRSVRQLRSLVPGGPRGSPRPRPAFPRVASHVGPKDATGASPADGAGSPKVEPQLRLCLPVPFLRAGRRALFLCRPSENLAGLDARLAPGPRRALKITEGSGRLSRLPVMWKKQMRSYSLCVEVFLSRGGKP
ncbi:hypothetical protein DBR06_SOUSAS9710075 [Sousa chinensis]|uniref:Uncharacterized protein n=1 Tax=Sousa chinensis TaxID=103600 RepID=A0A484GHR6_SOUCH|nr:hypothetical protein DBR06_SOUSAS9710075 [Sousa chinensis]